MNTKEIIIDDYQMDIIITGLAYLLSSVISNNCNDIEIFNKHFSKQGAINEINKLIGDLYKIY